MKIKLHLLSAILFFPFSVFSQCVPSYIPTNGLAGYWAFTGNANDSSGNSHNGTVFGATLTTNRFGDINSAYAFDGVSNSIEIPDDAGLKFATANQMSISLWFKMSAPSTGTGAVFLSKQTGVGGSQSGFNCGLLNTTHDLTCIAKNGSGGIQNIVATPSTSYTDGNWHSFMYTFDNGSAKIYLDNFLIASSDVAGSVIGDSIENLIFGTGNAGNVVYFNGILDDIALWNRPLTQEEITNIYYAENTCQSLVINTGVLGFNPITYNNTVTIYPNPTNDQITINCGNLANVSGWTIKIINTLGMEVFSGTMNQTEYVVPLNTFGGVGMYFVKIYDGSSNLVNTKKIILE